MIPGYISRRRLVKAGVLAAAAAPLRAAWATPGLASTPTAEAEPNPFGENATPGGTYTVAVASGEGAIRMFIPTSYYGTLAFFVSKIIYSPLLSLDANWQNLGPNIATSWEYSPDFKQLTMDLRQGIKFHDGEELTARDVEFTFKFMLRRDEYPAVDDISIFEGGQAYRERATEDFPGVQVIDDYTVRFNLIGTSAQFLLNLSNIGILPAHGFPASVLTEEGAADTIPFFSETPFGAGPFKLESFDVRTHITLEAHTDYFKGAPLLDGIVMRLGVPGAAQIAGLESGEFDGAWVAAAADARALQDRGTVNIVTNYSMANQKTLMFAAEKDYMNVRVRQALMHALDYEGLIETVTYGFARPAPSIMMHPSLFPNPDLPTYDYDPDQARALLEEGGWDPGRRLQFGAFSMDAQASTVYTQIMNLWRAVGVEAEYVPLDPANQVTILSDNRHLFDLIMTDFAWLAYNPVSTYRWIACGGVSNRNHYCNPEYDEIMQQAIRTAEPAAQTELLQQAQIIVQRDVPIGPVWIDPEIWGISKSMHGGVLGRGPLNDVRAELWWKE